MERSRKDYHGRRKRQKKNKNKFLLGLAAVAMVCAAGVWIIGQGSNYFRGNEANEQPPAVVQTEQPSPAGATGDPEPTPTELAGSAAAKEPIREADAAQPSPVVPKPAATRAPSGGAGDGTTVKLAFVGDVIFAGKVDTILKENGFDHPYKKLAKELSVPDFTIANLETPITTRGEQQVKEYTYRSSPEALKPFKAAGFDVVNLANNHILDYGVDGLLDTLDYLDQEGILRTGAGRNMEEAYQAAVVEKDGIRIAFLGLSHKLPADSWKATANKPGTTELYSTTRALQAIQDTKAKADLVVVIAHWGVERQDKPEKIHREMARTFIDAGADLVVGGHPHVLQGFEEYKGKWIAYSLGNFIFTTNTYEPSWETMILNAECGKQGDCRLSVLPVRTKYAQPVPMEGEAAAALLERLTSISFGARVSTTGAVEKAP